MYLFAKRLREKRKAKHLTQEELAKKVGITKTSISFYETGKKKPTYERLVELASVLEVDINYFLGNDCRIRTQGHPQYVFNMAKDEVEFMKEIRKHLDLYERLMENPQRAIAIIEKNLK